MANKQLRLNEGLKYASYFLISFLLISCSKSYSDYLVSNYQKEGTLYFIKEQSGWFSNSKDASFKYDITHRTSQDSLVLNFSFVSNDMKELEKIVVKKDSLELASNLEKFFIAPKDDKVHHRFSSTFSFSEFDSLLSLSKSHPTILLMSAESNTELRTNKWPKQREILQKNFEVMKANR